MKVLQKALTLLANVLIIGAIYIFATGFFPHKAFIPGLAKWQYSSSRPNPDPHFDKLIFMVVDALRSDFVYSNVSSFHFTQSLIRKGHALPFTGHASAPTVTMPRVKAITTGTVPSFVDFILNFAESDTTSTLASQDSWLAQMKAKRTGKLLMYGDDTWLRLFPGVFDRADGTTSFFVSDFTEVDLNVTRHIPAELKNDDWSTMVLHFLGLDHIGHKTGPRGANMPAKQRQMDGVVQEIYEAMQTEPHLASTLLVLLGDHGMNEGGNHGASSAGEVSTALTFVSPKLSALSSGRDCPVLNVEDYEYYKVVEQSDIVPTLAALLGFPIPVNNLGMLIEDFLPMWSDYKEQYDLLYQNALQIHKIAEGTFLNAFQNLPSNEPVQWKNDAEELAWKGGRVLDRDSTIEEDGQSLSRNMYSFLRTAQKVLSGTASNYDLSKMYIGFGLAGAALFLCLICYTGQAMTFNVPVLCTAFVFIVYGITMFASSFVEEEQFFWYWVLGAWLILLTCKAGRFTTKSTISLSSQVIIFLLFGFTRRWNQTGQKYAGEPDLVTELFTPNPWLLWTLIILTYAYITRNLSLRAAKWLQVRQMAGIPVLITSSAFLFKLAFTWADAPELLTTLPIFHPLITFTTKYPLVNLARVAFLGQLYLLLCALYYESPWSSPTHRQHFLTTFHNILSLFLISQTRTVNIPLILIFHVQLSLLQSSSYNLTPTEISLTTLLFHYASFFAVGGTNAISTIDLSNAYNGISGYYAGLVGILTFVSNWVGPIWWTSATCLLLQQHKTKLTAQSESEVGKGGERDLWWQHFLFHTSFACVSTLSVMVACTVLREHLFIWTVFSPKYLYIVGWVVGQHVLINGIVGWVLIGI